MKLSEWMQANGYNIYTLAIKLGYSRLTLHQSNKGTNAWSEDAMQAIYKISNGEVTPNDILLDRWNGDGGEGGGGGTLDPDDPANVGAGGDEGGALHKGARGTISGPLYALAAQVEAHGL